MDFLSGINQILLFAVLSLLTIALALHVFDKLKKFFFKPKKETEHTLERIHQLDNSPVYQVQQPAAPQIYYETPPQYNAEGLQNVSYRDTRETRPRQSPFEHIITAQSEAMSKTKDEKQKIDRNFVSHHFK